MKTASSRKAEALFSFFTSCKRRERSRLARPVFPTPGSSACMRAACKRWRKPRCIESERLGPGEFTQRAAVTPSFPAASLRCGASQTRCRTRRRSVVGPSGRSAASRACVVFIILMVKHGDLNGSNKPDIHPSEASSVRSGDGRSYILIMGFGVRLYTALISPLLIGRGAILRRPS